VTTSYSLDVRKDKLNIITNRFGNAGKLTIYSGTKPSTGAALNVVDSVNYQDLGTTNYNSTLIVGRVIRNQISSKMSTSHNWSFQVAQGTPITSTIQGQSSGSFTVEIAMLFIPDM